MNSATLFFEEYTIAIVFFLQPVVAEERRAGVIFFKLLQFHTKIGCHCSNLVFGSLDKPLTAAALAALLALESFALLLHYIRSVPTR